MHALPSVHEKPLACAGWLGEPLLQTSLVQALPSSAGMSELSTTLVTLPLPSHAAARQSPGVCAAIGVFAAVNVTPQTPPPQVRAWHASSLPGQSGGALQPTHDPAASQRRAAPQVVPWGLGGFEARPWVQTSSVQAF